MTVTKTEAINMDKYDDALILAWPSCTVTEGQHRLKEWHTLAVRVCGMPARARVTPHYIAGEEPRPADMYLCHEHDVSWLDAVECGAAFGTHVRL